MSEIRTEVKTFRVTMQCDKCGEGLMQWDGMTLTSYPPWYPHTCDHCGHKKNFREHYPYIDHQ